MAGQGLRCGIAGALLLIAGVFPGDAHAHSDREVLWHIVHEQCVPDQRYNREPAPCVEVDLSEGEERGYAVLRDTAGPEQFLLIPTARITGIEDPALLRPDAPNYFADAWRAKAFTEAAAGGTLARNWVSLAINSTFARTQDQLHIHIDCLRADVHQAIADAAGYIGQSWSPLPVPLGGDSYDAIAISDLDSVNPFVLAAEPSEMALTTLVVIGTGTEDRPGFVVLRRLAAAGSSDPAAGEDLQDHDSCPAPLPAGPFTGK